MKKVECPSCGATGVIMLSPSWGLPREAHLCTKCNGFGFILIDPAEFAKFKKAYNSRYGCTGGIKTSLNDWSSRWNKKGSPPEYTEFAGLCKVRRLRNRHVMIPVRGWVAYGVFYKEHKNPRV